MHTTFIAAADAYCERLRQYFEPLSLSNAADPRRSCPECPGRLNFTRYDDATAFEPEIDASAGLRWSPWTSLYLTILVVSISLLARRRFSEWPL